MNWFEKNSLGSAIAELFYSLRISHRIAIEVLMRIFFFALCIEKNEWGERLETVFPYLNLLFFCKFFK